jgi:hypothetical protein
LEKYEIAEFQLGENNTSSVFLKCVIRNKIRGLKKSVFTDLGSGLR